jgi:undecaprenyl-diphosphatase
MDRYSVRRDRWALVGIVGFVGFLLVASLVGGRIALAFDVEVAATVRGLPVPVGFWEACTFLGGAILIPFAVGLVVAAALSGRIRLAVIVAVVLIGATLFTDAVKDLIARPRPPWEALAPAVGFSFPSGHTLQGTVVYGLLALVAWRSRLPLAVRRAVVGVGVVVPVLVGLSRIALGVHFPSDVLAGWFGGVAFVALGACLIGAFGAMEPDRVRTGTETSKPEAAGIGRASIDP